MEMVVTQNVLLKIGGSVKMVVVKEKTIVYT